MAYIRALSKRHHRLVYSGVLIETGIIPSSNNLQTKKTGNHFTKQHTDTIHFYIKFLDPSKWANSNHPWCENYPRGYIRKLHIRTGGRTHRLKLYQHIGALLKSKYWKTSKMMTPSKLKFESQMDTWINGFLTLSTPMTSKDKMGCPKIWPFETSNQCLFSIQTSWLWGGNNFSNRAP